MRNLSRCKQTAAAELFMLEFIVWQRGRRC
jgi:hypothetical protein